jgi:hypothetical protein
MLDEHTRSVLRDGPPLVLRMDNEPEFICYVLQRFCSKRIETSYIPPGTPWKQRTHRILQQQATRSA